MQPEGENARLGVQSRGWEWGRAARGSECAEAAFPVRSTPFLPQPQSLIDELLLYKRSEDQIELKEKQLSTMRVDVCSTETLKCLKGKDPAGSRDTHVELSGPLASVEP